MKRKTIKKRNRSGKFPCDICGDIGYLEEHHINGRKLKDYNMSWNICNICPNCHYMVHLGELIIEQWAYSTYGKFLSFHYKGKEGDFPDSKTHII